jgi:superfamily I DNA/RNA helicase
MTLTPTPEQLAIIDFIRTRPEPLIISALAGAAKTSTLVLAAHAHKVSTLALAFNKRIAEELTQRMPSHVECRTLNGLGHRAWSSYLGRRVTLDTNKRGRLLKAELERAGGRDKDELWRAWPDLADTYDLAYRQGWVPDRTHPNAKRFIGDDAFRAGLPADLSDLEFLTVRRAVIASLDEGVNGTIHFDDQLLLPIIYPASFESYPQVLGDEAQDWSMLNQEMIAKLVKRGARLVAVGDECQAIYGFRGADQESMATLRERFGMETLHLTTSFRCASSVAEHVRWRAPAIRSPEWAVPGTITRLAEWTADDLPESAAIICRNNAPLLQCAMRLLRAGRKPEIRGNDITKGILKVMKKLGAPALTREDLAPLWDKESKALIARYKNSSFIQDKLACIQFFLDAEPTLGLAIARAEHIMNASGPLQLMTGHKSKGLEFRDVFFLDEHLINRDRGGQQEDNLRYVICTRAKENLTYITSEGWRGDALEDAA